jgi:8-oxo-dGTP pyrophosphatase MutT (NUDIX family)
MQNPKKEITMKVKDGVFVILFKDLEKKEVFLILRSDMPIWNLPGGAIEDGETPEEGVIRETKEETDFEIELVHFVGKYNHIDAKTEKLLKRTYLYEGKILEGEFKPEFPGCEGKWFPVKKLPENIRPITALRVKDTLEFSGNAFEKEFRRK